MQSLIQVIDQCLISFYRLTGRAGLDFVIGTFILAVLCLLIGEATLCLVFRLSRKHLEKQAAEAAKYHTLSMDALKAGDKEAFAAVNQLANESYGQSFFQQAALSGAFLWPIFFALAWMQNRFIEVEFPIPGTSWSLGFIGMFILIYLAGYFLIKQAKKRMAYCRRPQERLEASGRAARELNSLADLVPAAPGSKAADAKAGKSMS